MRTSLKQNATPREIIQWTLRAVITFGVVAAGLMLAAGRIDYWHGWLYTALNMAVMAATVITLRNRADLMRERMKPGRGMKRWDLVYFIISTVMYLAALAVAALDAGRFGWGPGLSPVIVVIAAVVYAAGQAVFIWAKYENRFLSSVVRIQKDRGQKVCDTGPYRFVRHPSYAAGIIFAMAGPVLLGSLWALIPQAVACIALVVRTALEDGLLRRELPGYAAYAKNVKYRLVPGVW